MMIRIFENPSKNICQGDIFIPNSDEFLEIFPKEVYGTDILPKGFIVISNTCDIKNKNISFINICPIISLEFMVESIKTEKEKQGKRKKDIKKSIESNIKNLVRYNQKKYFYLPKDKEFNIDDEWVVLLEFILTYDRDDIIPLINNRRICSIKNPWKEKLGWTLGNFYSRVSLEDHPPKKIDELIKRVEK